MSRIGTRTVVNAGYMRVAKGLSSYPTTERSSGIRRPCVYAAFVDAGRHLIIAREDRRRTRLLGQQRRGALHAALEGIGAFNDQLGRQLQPVRRKRSRKPFALLTRGTIVRRPGDEADLLVTQRRQMLTRFSRRRSIVRHDHSFQLVERRRSNTPLRAIDVGQELSQVAVFRHRRNEKHADQLLPLDKRSHVVQERRAVPVAGMNDQLVF